MADKIITNFIFLHLKNKFITYSLCTPEGKKRLYAVKNYLVYCSSQKQRIVLTVHMFIV